MQRLSTVVVLLVAVAAVALKARAAQTPPASSGWKVPATAATEKNPLTVNDAVLAAGKRFFAHHCESCHGVKGKGDGPDADKEHKEHMDLTSPARAAENPDGVVFYKVWNGRSSPKMPAFGEDLPKEQVWAIVAYVQSLRGR
jgi:mono/diheme cytochrome c family protein